MLVEYLVYAMNQACYLECSQKDFPNPRIFILCLSRNQAC